eukprot:5262829-Ditylum_brightwellii.AAC.1
MPSSLALHTPASIHTKSQQIPTSAQSPLSMMMPRQSFSRSVHDTRLFYRQGGLDENSPRGPRNRHRGKGPRNNSGQTSSAKSRREKYIWLQTATMNLLNTEIYPHGSLTKGKWHELHSMMMAWCKLIAENSAAAAGIRKK